MLKKAGYPANRIFGNPSIRAVQSAPYDFLVLQLCFCLVCHLRYDKLFLKIERGQVALNTSHLGVIYDVYISLWLCAQNLKCLVSSTHI